MKTLEPSLSAKADFVRSPFVQERFSLRKSSRDRVLSTSWSFGFGAFSEVVYHDNGYCRIVDGKLETWPETILRVVNGTFSIRKDWYKKNGLPWVESYWQELAEEMAISFLRLECGPPGRGYAHMGTDYVYDRGGFALINCAATEVRLESLADDLAWAMDALACGSGVGFGIKPQAYALTEPSVNGSKYTIPDTREGWVESVWWLVNSYLTAGAFVGRVSFDYSEIRPAGSPLKGIGGVATGPEPLKLLHNRMRETLSRGAKSEISWTRLIADLANQIGACVKSGPRASAEILIGDPEDTEFLDLKDLSLPENYYRKDWYWASNNSPALTKREHFPLIATQIAPRAMVDGEPGYINSVATQKFARFGRQKWDPGTLYNPCCEIPLVNKETCNVAEVYPSRAVSVVRAAELTCLYASTVALLPTHRQETNAIVSRNRRIGVSMSGIADWQSETPDITRALRVAYESVVKYNAELAAEAGIPASIRCTTVKPSGTVSQLAGVSPGGHFAMGNFFIRRKRVSKNSPFVPILMAAGYPFEQDVAVPDNLVFEFHQRQEGVKTQAEAGMHEQALQLAMLQREWSDNAVSFTVEFADNETKKLPALMSQIAPMVKSLSVLPRSHGYAQTPYEEITEREVKMRDRLVKPLDWSQFKEELPAEADKFCSIGGKCEVKDVPNT